MTRDLMSRYDRPRAWPIIVAIIVAAVLGSIAVPVQILLAKQSQSATHDQVQQSQVIIQNNAKIARDERAGICERINQIITYDRLPVRPCPVGTGTP
jgi:uncharacterized membrane protein YdfJ with MMPL/SSD domain